MDSANTEKLAFKHPPEPQIGPQQPTLSSTQIKSREHDQLISPDTRVVDYIEEGDPLQNDRVLLQGIRIAEPGDDGPNTIRKVPSDQLLSMFRWGSNHRVTGRSKSGLQILVPGREASATVITGGPFSGKSIIYTYASSSDSSGKTTNSLGAIGDHLLTGRTGFFSGSRLSAVPVDQSIKQARDATSTDRMPRSPLADLVADSTPDADEYEARAPLADLVADLTPDVEPYRIFIAGEKGPCAKPTVPRVVSLKDFPLLPSRRRSLSDLIEDTKTLHSPTNSCIPTSAASQISTGTKTACPNGTDSSCQGVPIQQSDPENILEPLTAPVWERAGPPFASIHSKGAGASTQEVCLPDNFDPQTFCFPFGSKIFVMKSANIRSLRESVVTGVWSSSKGANRVLQNAWESKTKNEKIVFLFSISQSHLYSGKYCGMAEMSGPYDPNVDPQFWIAELRGSEGIIPMRWIVTKDVDFSLFVDLKYRGILVTELRHANTVPGEAGRSLVQAYFEAEHPRTSILHPQGQCTGMSSSATFKNPVKPSEWPAPRTTTPPDRRPFRDGSNAGMILRLRSRPMYRSTRGGHRVREMRPLPPFLNLMEINGVPFTRDPFTFGRPYPHAGISQRMTSYHRPNPLYRPAAEGIYPPSSNIDYAASNYSSPAPSFSQAPFNSRPRVGSRPLVSYTQPNEMAMFYPPQGHGTLSFGS